MSLPTTGHLRQPREYPDQRAVYAHVADCLECHTRLGIPTYPLDREALCPEGRTFVDDARQEGAEV